MGRVCSLSTGLCSARCLDIDTPKLYRSGPAATIPQPEQYSKYVEAFLRALYGAEAGHDLGQFQGLSRVGRP
jgi:hypothetical protein